MVINRQCVALYQTNIGTRGCLTQFRVRLLSKKYSFPWIKICWPFLVFDSTKRKFDSDLTTSDLIPVGRGKLIIGHNTPFDRSKLAEEYEFENSGNRFMDTMSMHRATHGLTTDQRNLFNKTEFDSKIQRRAVEKWTQHSAMSRIGWEKTRFDTHQDFFTLSKVFPLASISIVLGKSRWRNRLGRYLSIQW